MTGPKRVALSVAGCFFACVLLLPLSRFDYVETHAGFEIAVTRSSVLIALAGSHGRSEEAVLRIAGGEFRMLAGRSPFYMGDRHAKWLVCVSTETWLGTIVIIAGPCENM